MLNVARVRHRVRLIQVLAAADRAALTPLSMDKLHAFAYLADILSPVWQLRPFEDRIGRTKRTPFYPDLQREVDALVAMGIVEPSGLNYRIEDEVARLEASFDLRSESEHLPAIRQAIADDEALAAEQSYLNALAEALASLPDDDIAKAATRDLAYERSANDADELVTLSDLTSRSSRAVASFDKAFPHLSLTPSRKLVMYAQYLGRRANG